MPQWAIGDDVKIDIPDEADIDHARYHGLHGTIVDHLHDDAESVTGDERDSVIYRVELETGEEIDCRWRDLRPILE